LCILISAPQIIKFWTSSCISLLAACLATVWVVKWLWKNRQVLLWLHEFLVFCCEISGLMFEYFIILIFDHKYNKYFIYFMQWFLVSLSIGFLYLGFQHTGLFFIIAGLFIVAIFLCTVKPTVVASFAKTQKNDACIVKTHYSKGKCRAPAYSLEFNIWTASIFTLC